MSGTYDAVQYTMTVADVRRAVAKLDAVRYAALRDAVARLMATGDAGWPWWFDGTGCRVCDSPWADTAADVTHAPDCPAMAVEAAMEVDDA